MARLLTGLLILFGFATQHLEAENDEIEIIVIVSTPGNDEYKTLFSDVAEKWKKAASRGRAPITVIGEDSVPEGEKATDAEQLRQAIEGSEAPELWIVLIGHGSFDGRTAKFNARGPDFSDNEFASWLVNREGETAVINTTAASGSFISELSGPKRVVITATQNEGEIDFARFGNYFPDAIAGAPEADLDNDDQVSLLEAFIHASNKVALFYQNEGRIATEHALLDDNGDGKGSRAEWYEGTTATRVVSDKAEPDGELAGQKALVKNDFERRLSVEQRRERDALERDVKQLRRKRDDMEEAVYYTELESLLLRLAKIYEAVGDS